MVRISIPGLTGLALRVAVTTNGVTWTAGVVDPESRAVETAHDVIPASKIKRVCYMGTGTWLPPDEMRAAVLVLSAVAGLGSQELWELAHEGTGLDPHRRLQEIPSGLNPLSLDREEQRRIGLLEAS